ncbi:RNA polymerase sigma factor [Actinokineospora diospyrosa]|uniref:RNA polymerase sigma-70 factor, ECF subfamily n=1 Tax=Actinokineospora diospyrosa TaxID=103728 RepID=A0ABT1IBZ4_9PSEU|nr:sigma-70 family RNA polymerase sigma factor [Actinokineospora diospyrosa]MCP2270152.1 RNA polymerase sigma-70 factor, ECF subfamily [Actinokineospora diospyrosa]
MAEKPHDAFDRLYRRHHDAVRRFLGRRLTAADVDDATAEVFVVTWRRLAELPADDRVLPWLYGVARLVLANEFRRARRADRLVLRIGGLADEPPGDGSNAVVDRLVLAAAFDTLPERDQEVLRLVAWEQLTAAEIAVVLDCGRTTAAMRVSRAGRRLLRALAQAEVAPVRQGVH